MQREAWLSPGWRVGWWRASDRKMHACSHDRWVGDGGWGMGRGWACERVTDRWTADARMDTAEGQNWLTDEFMFNTTGGMGKDPEETGTD